MADERLHSRDGAVAFAAQLRERGVETVVLAGADTHGILRGKRGAAAPPLPATVGEATDLLERSALARAWLGDDVVDHCVALRRSELAAQAAAVTDWEIRRYLEAL